MTVSIAEWNRKDILRRQCRALTLREVVKAEFNEKMNLLVVGAG